MTNSASARLFVGVSNRTSPAAVRIECITTNSASQSFSSIQTNKTTNPLSLVL